MNGAICFRCNSPILPHETMSTTLIMGSYVVVHNPRDENNACNEIDHPTTLKENTVNENTTPATPLSDLAEQADEATLSWLQQKVSKHPRASRVVAIIGAAGTVGFGVMLTNTLRANKENLVSAADHLSEAGNELSTAVVPKDSTES